MDAANVGEREIATVVDVAVEIQVVWPDAQMNTRGREQIDFGFGKKAKADTSQAQPRKHNMSPARVRYSSLSLT